MVINEVTEDRAFWTAETLKFFGITELLIPQFLLARNSTSMKFTYTARIEPNLSIIESYFTPQLLNKDVGKAEEEGKKNLFDIMAEGLQESNQE